MRLLVCFDNDEFRAEESRLRFRINPLGLAAV